jgi:transposase
VSGAAGCGSVPVKEDAMAKPLVTDELWATIEPLLPPPPPPNPKGGRPRVPDRDCLTGILFVLKTGIAWEDLPQEMGCGCGMTCWRRLRDWHEAGVWRRLHETLLAELRKAGLLELAAVIADASYLRAFLGAKAPAPARSTAAKPAPSTTCWSTPTAPRWSPPRPRPTRTTASNCSRW